MHTNPTSYRDLKAEQLFFVDSIHTTVEDDKTTVDLLSTQPIENNIYGRSLELTRQQLQMTNHLGAIREGWFVYYIENENRPFRYGNLSLLARDHFREFNEVQKRLLEKTITPSDDLAFIPREFMDDSKVEVFSYHINCGHGNCSVILIQAENKYEIWMVDCSVIDKRQWKSYQNNIDVCLNDIAAKLKITDGKIHIDRFFLTHTHFDHYNGIEYLVDNHIIDDKTFCYMNLYYNMASPTYLRILKKLESAEVSFIEPISKNSNSNICFLHPECRLFRSKDTITSYVKPFRVVNNPINNSSVVIQIGFGGHRMVFPGDLEKRGFDKMTKEKYDGCSPFLSWTDYYVVSHHGSDNGHPVWKCRNTSKPFDTPLQCLDSSIKKAILMGRDGAYPQIYSKSVVSYWKNRGKLEYTEKAPHYLLLHWNSGLVSMV